MLHRGLASVVRGQVFAKEDTNFKSHARLFNVHVISNAQILVLPLDALDVSATVQFCNANGLSFSVKSGGYGVAGFAAAGDVIIDLAHIDEISITPPNDDGGFNSMGKVRRMPVDVNIAMPVAVRPPSPPSTARRRGADEAFGFQETFRNRVTGFLAGIDVSDLPSPSIKRRLDEPPHISSRERSDDSSSSSAPDGQSSRQSSGQSNDTIHTPDTTQTTPEPPPISPEKENDPFGYMSFESSDQGFESQQTSRTPPELPPVAGPSSAPAGPSFPMLGNYISTLEEMNATADRRATPSAPYAYVTFGAGARQRDVDAYTESHPLPGTSLNGSPCVIPYHVPFAAHPVGSSVMILAGFGFQSRLRGLSIDALCEAEFVLPDGRILLISEKSHPDLWWAIRGAGPAFGIATRFVAKAYPVPVVFAGNLIYNFNPATAPSLMRHLRDCIKGAPRELYANLLLTAGPQGRGSLVVIQLCYIGPKDEGQPFLQAIASWDGERCVLNEVHEKSFFAQQESVAQVLRAKSGKKWFIRSILLETLPDEVIAETVSRFADTPAGCTWFFELAGGAVSDVSNSCFPLLSRSAQFTVAAFHQWETLDHEPRCVTAAEEWMASPTLQAVSRDGPLPTFLARHERVERVRGSFGENWEKLVQLKKVYDPAGRMKHCFWPLDANGNELDGWEGRQPESPQLQGIDGLPDEEKKDPRLGIRSLQEGRKASRAGKLPEPVGFALV